MKTKVIPVIIRNKDRFVIVDEDTGEIIDDSKGYGYTTESAANKSMWYIFKGGEDKIKNQKLEVKKFFKDNPEIYDFITDFYNKNFSDKVAGQFSYDSIIDEVKKIYNIDLPKYYLKYM